MVRHPVVVEGLSVAKHLNSEGMSNVVTGSEGATECEPSTPAELGSSEIKEILGLVGEQKSSSCSGSSELKHASNESTFGLENLVLGQQILLGSLDRYGRR